MKQPDIIDEILPASWRKWPGTLEYLRPPDHMTPSQWTESNRVLGYPSAERGPFRFDKTPYIREPLDCMQDPLVEEIVVIKATQVGYSEMIRNFLGYIIDKDPGPTMIVMPDRDIGEKIFERYILAMIESTDVLKKKVENLKRWFTKATIKIPGMTIDVGWAGSPTSLASHPIQNLLFDETDKFPIWAGREADPISLGEERTDTYQHRRRIFKGSSPTTRHGAISKAFEACADKRYFNVPCPHCGKYQVLTFPQIKWNKGGEKDKRIIADKVESTDSAWYECFECKKRIFDKQKKAMLRKGVWANEDQHVDNDGSIIGQRPYSKRVGFHISGLMSPWKSFSKIAAKWLRAYGDPALMMNFRNSILGEVFEEQINSVNISILAKKREKAKLPMIVPPWAQVIVASADTQIDHFYFIVRAWGYQYRSQLIHFGRVETFDDLKAVTIDAGYQWAGGEGVFVPPFLVIDSGGGTIIEGQSRTDQVYRFSRSDPGRVIPIKGYSGTKPPRSPIVVSSINYSPPQPDGTRGTAYKVGLRIIDTNYFKDILASRIEKEFDDVGYWDINTAITPDYDLQIASERKIFDPKSMTFRWVPKTAGAPNHYWDCEVYNCVGADLCQVGLAPSPDEVIVKQSTPRRRDQNSGRSGRGGRNWVSRKGK